ncbi:MAG: hypothetical protein ACD_52C00119G0001 [uncultured bacterium]|nr:MAG: hypothetical protein ACD_52C00119G0001 [uncultured bacterium]
MPDVGFVLLPSTFTFSSLPATSFASKSLTATSTSTATTSFSCNVRGETKIVTVAFGKNHQAAPRPTIARTKIKKPTSKVLFAHDLSVLTLNFGNENDFLIVDNLDEMPCLA